MGTVSTPSGRRTRPCRRSTACKSKLYHPLWLFGPFLCFGLPTQIVTEYLGAYLNHFQLLLFFPQYRKEKLIQDEKIELENYLLPHAMSGETVQCKTCFPRH